MEREKGREVGRRLRERQRRKAEFIGTKREEMEIRDEENKGESSRKVEEGERREGGG